MESLAQLAGRDGLFHQRLRLLATPLPGQNQHCYHRQNQYDPYDWEASTATRRLVDDVAAAFDFHDSARLLAWFKGKLTNINSLLRDARIAV